MTTASSLTCSAGPYTWNWTEQWAKLPPMTGHSHHGLVINRAGQIVTGHATDPEILILDTDGNLLRSFPVPVVETHGLCLAEEQGEEVLFIADVSEWQAADGKVIKVDFDGNVLMEITKADIPGYTDDEWFSPTTVAWDHTNGDIWITDGYGKSRIHRLTSTGEHVLTINGSEGQTGAFKNPHWIMLDPRKDEPELYVADRAQNRVQIYNRDGEWLRAITEGLVTPSVFTTFGDTLIIGELKARLVVLDGDDQILGYLGDGTEYVSKEGWPNRVQDGKKVPPHFDIEPGKFNSPHGIAADANGTIYISEWLLGDRFIKLERVLD